MIQLYSLSYFFIDINKTWTRGPKIHIKKTLTIDPNEFFIPTIETELINSPLTISVCGVEFCRLSRAVKRGNWNSVISWIVIDDRCWVDDSLIVLNWSVCFNTRIVLGLEVIVFNLVVY